MPNGLFAWYNKSDRLGGTGTVNKRGKDGTLYIYDDTGMTTAAIYFDNGKRKKKID